MLIPKGEPRFQNLSTAYTDLPALLKTLKAEGFSGTVEVEFPGHQGTVFAASGEIINAEVRKGTDSKRLTGQEAMQDILNLSSQRDGIVHVYRMSSDRAAAVAGMLQSIILFKELSSDFIRVDRLIVKLREEKHNGFMEILTRDRKEMGVLLLQDGEIADLFASSETGICPVETKNIPIVLEHAVKQGILLNVYRNQGKTTVREHAAKETSAKETGEKETVVKEPPAKETPVKEVSMREPSAMEVPVRKKPAAGTNGGSKEVIPVLQDILSKVEKVADDESRKGTFSKEFKRSLIEKSGEYPFLDPFAGEFDYREGVIGFKGDAGKREFTKGVGECLRVTLDHLEDEFPKKKALPARLMLEIESLLEHHREGLKRLGVDTVLHSVFQ